MRFTSLVANSYVQLRWSAGGSPFLRDQIVPSDRLFFAPDSLGNSPFLASISVQPGPGCASLSTPYGMGMTIGTAGLLSSFAIASRDAFANERREGTDVFVAQLFQSDQASDSAHIVFDANAREYVASFTQTRAGLSLVDVHLLERNGLQATFYSDSSLSAPVSAMHQDAIDFSARADALLPFISLPARATWSARWSGFIDMPYAQAYTFFLSVVSETDRVRLWVDNRIVIDQWSSLDISSEVNGSLAVNAG
eukprot:1620791-Rhodomonas_salina.1